MARARAAGAIVIVNDRADIARLSAADGVHVGQEDLEPAAARRILGGSAIDRHLDAFGRSGARGVAASRGLHCGRPGLRNARPRTPDMQQVGHSIRRRGGRDSASDGRPQADRRDWRDHPRAGAGSDSQQARRRSRSFRICCRPAILKRACASICRRCDASIEWDRDCSRRSSCWRRFSRAARSGTS